MSCAITSGWTAGTESRSRTAGVSAFRRIGFPLTLLGSLSPRAPFYGDLPPASPPSTSRHPPPQRTPHEPHPPPPLPLPLHRPRPKPAHSPRPPPPTPENSPTSPVQYLFPPPPLVPPLFFYLTPRNQPPRVPPSSLLRPSPPLPPPLFPPRKPKSQQSPHRPLWHLLLLSLLSITIKEHPHPTLCDLPALPPLSYSDHSTLPSHPLLSPPPGPPLPHPTNNPPPPRPPPDLHPSPPRPRPLPPPLPPPPSPTTPQPPTPADDPLPPPPLPPPPPPPATPHQGTPPTPLPPFYPPRGLEPDRGGRPLT